MKISVGFLFTKTQVEGYYNITPLLECKNKKDKNGKKLSDYFEEVLTEHDPTSLVEGFKQWYAQAKAAYDQSPYGEHRLPLFQFSKKYETIISTLKQMENLVESKDIPALQDYITIFVLTKATQ